MGPTHMIYSLQGQTRASHLLQQARGKRASNMHKDFYFKKNSLSLTVQRAEFLATTTFDSVMFAHMSWKDTKHTKMLEGKHE